METKKNLVNLIELYLSDKGNRFIRGFYYDFDQMQHELEAFIHVGLIVDSCLVHLSDDFVGGFVCRYYIQPESVEFYDTLYHQQEYLSALLIHNCSDKPMKVTFEFSSESWEIEPRGKSIIIPPTISNRVAIHEMTDDEKIDVVARKILDRYKPAFEELAKGPGGQDENH